MIPKPAPGGLAAALALAALLAAAPAAPAPAVTCHCFRDRAYDPADPAKTDAYLLATASNTLLAAAYGFPKGRIVRERMAGVPAEELWIALYAGARLGVGADELRAARAAAPSWREALQRTGGPLEELAPAFLAAVAGGAGEAAIARAAAGATVAASLGTPGAELEGLTARGATLQETVLAALLGAWADRPPTAVLQEVRGNGTAWSAVLDRLGLAPTDLERSIPAALEGRRP